MADTVSKSDKISTLYEYFTDGGIQSGLNDKKPYFTLNGKEITILSGALHYFRVPRDYWKDRLRKYRAAGLNTVETYIPWNLHEYEDGIYDFGQGGSDFQDFLDLDMFIKLAKEEDLFVILRPGPYICAELDFGGLPSWLLRYDGIKIRTSDAKYVNLVKRYFIKLLRIVAPLQFTKGGPIIAVQIENEYGNLADESNKIDTKHLKQLKDILQENGIVELLFTSDTPSNGFTGTVPEVLATANFQHEPEKELTLLKNFQPNKPLMVMEYWTGWFDHWAERHHTRTADNFGEVLDCILNFGASVNFYMFHGGTNWGFLNGANLKNKSVTATDNETHVFRQKLKSLISYITKLHVFGPTRCWLYSVEWQKRGLPHAHILVWLIDKIHPEEINSIICAEIPDPSTDQVLFDIVTANMIHGPCGTLHRSSPCMADGKCTKNLPKDFTNDTITNTDEYPIYRRRSLDNGGYSFIKNISNTDIDIDNRWVVLYSPLLSKTYNAHINVEFCCSVKSIKYICKYVHKGSDMVVFRVENTNANAPPTLLDGGRTAHSVFKLPLNIQNNPDAVCNIKKQSSMATVLKQCKIIIWDECTMAHNHSIEALNRTMKDIKNNDKLFGALCWCFQVISDKYFPSFGFNIR
ncbi:unnamed protein product [Diabrotica balteata]|uniref:Multifunctional fusion protein n=1 Tax=Diabrotica balteata TaxID=107213 RepID=A0A9N9T4B3_DIABA|nr:unnamed protein product [Diabrotica balteata]